MDGIPINIRRGGGREGEEVGGFKGHRQSARLCPSNVEYVFSELSSPGGGGGGGGVEGGLIVSKGRLDRWKSYFSLTGVYA